MEKLLFVSGKHSFCEKNVLMLLIMIKSYTSWFFTLQKSLFLLIGIRQVSQTQKCLHQNYSPSEITIVPGPGYLRFEDEVVWLCHLLVFGSQHDEGHGGR